ncbi:cordon-bleu protein-like 1 isoform X2 [Hyperolius riggenbachi]|uniref:cordon-bleu protein-like 1 isoform X2 n=1 Tax=Hyperolius riggenbachi TaxID=752182 RepID=UPI0035A33A47
MDDSGSWSETSSPDATLPSQGKKAKGKAPLPPGEGRYSDSSPSYESADTVHYNMDQKENIDRDIDLKVVLPGERVTSTIVNGSKPMMDLLVFLCGQYHLNPSTYTIELLSADKSQLKFKPNTPIGMLEVESVVLKSKNLDDKNKKPGPTVPEQTVRVVINYKRTQKTVMRVSPFIPLQDLIPSISSKCEFDPRTTVLLQDYQSQRPLDTNKSLNDLGLRELYAKDQSKATSPTEIRMPPLQETCQNVEIKQNEEKRFFNFFRRSTKKKRDQTSSAPATPILNKPRLQNVVRANTVTKTYDSNTMLSDGPKKRRAPLPPMGRSSHNTANEIHRGQIRTSSCLVKSVSVDDSERSGGFDRSRTGSFQHSATAVFNSSFRSTKRKAPLPPSPPPKPPHTSDENSNDIVHISEEVNYVKMQEYEKQLDTTPPTEVIAEPDLQGVEEKEESHVSLTVEENASLKEEVNGSVKEETSSSSTEEQCEEIQVTDEAMASETPNDSMVSSVDNISKISQEEVITDCTTSLYSRDGAATENTTLEYDKIGECNNRTSTPTAELEKPQITETKTVITEQASQTLPFEKHTESTKIVTPSSHVALTETREVLTPTNAQKGKTQDSAVQTVNFDSDLEITAKKEFSHLREMTHSGSSTDNIQHHLNGHTTEATQFNGHQMPVAGKENTKEELIRNFRESVETQTVQENAVESSQSRAQKMYKPHSDPKISNEITRDYLPKIGMTTYKIIPQRSFDAERYMESEDPHEVQNMENRTVNEHVVSDTVTTPNAPFSLGPVKEQHEHFSEVKNGHHSFQASTAYQSTTVSKTVAEPSRRDHFALSRSLSAAPVLSTDKVPPEVKPKPTQTSPVRGPSSFYLQMQKRASSMYVTSAIAKTKASANSANSTAKVTPLGNETTQATIKTLPSKTNVVHLTSSVEEKLLEPSSSGTPYEVKNGRLGSISEDSTENENSFSNYSMESNAKLVQNEVSSVAVSTEYKRHVSFEDHKQNVGSEPPMLVKFYDSISPISEAPSTDNQVVHQEYKSEVSTGPKLTRTLSSPTNQSAPLSLQKLRTFATPRPFASMTPAPFSSAVTSVVKRSQSFSSSTSPITSPTKLPLIVDAPIGWSRSPVTSPVELKKDPLVLSVDAEEVAQNQEDQTLTPELKYRVHSPPPVPEKKTTVSFPAPDPEQLRQDIMAAIRSGEAAANLKRITIRSNTFSINRRAQISHPAFSQSLPED